MARRIHVPVLAVGETRLDAAQAHHARDVLRLTQGAEVEVFDDAGRVARGTLRISSDGVAVRVERIEEPSPGPFVRLTLASAVPKGDRADWMVEKLSELGVAAFVPLATARSVVLPGGRNKRDRWARIATEAAKQSRRAGVMHIAELTSLEDALKQPGPLWYLATERGVKSTDIAAAVAALPRGSEVVTFVGPEGGWTDDELRQFEASRAQAVRLTDTILRIETAAVAVAAVFGSLTGWSTMEP